jgi:hypothetical protein
LVSLQGLRDPATASAEASSERLLADSEDPGGLGRAHPLVGDEEKGVPGPFGERIERRRGPTSPAGEDGAGFGVEIRNPQLVSHSVEGLDRTAPPRGVRPDAPGDGEEQGAERTRRGSDEAPRTAQEEDEEVLYEVASLVPVSAAFEERRERGREPKGFQKDRLDRRAPGLLRRSAHSS